MVSRHNRLAARPRASSRLLWLSCLVVLCCCGPGVIAAIGASRDGSASSAPQLLNIEVSEGVLSPPFSSSQQIYSLDVGFLTSRLRLDVPVANGAARVRYEDQLADVLATGSLVIDVPQGRSNLTIVVGDRVYSVRIDRGFAAELQARQIVTNRPGNLLSGFDPTASDNFVGWSLAAEGDTLVVAEPVSERGVFPPRGPGFVRVFSKSPAGWEPQSGRLTASNAGNEDGFGYSIALSGDLLVVGAPFEDGAFSGVGASQSGDSLFDSGAVYVFRRIAGQFVQEEFIKSASPQGAAPGVNAGNLGFQVAAHGDLIAVSEGGCFCTAPVFPAVSLYERAEGGWQIKARIESSQNTVLSPSLVDPYGLWTAEAPSAPDNPNPKYGRSLDLDSSWLVIGDPTDRSMGIGVGADPLAPLGSARTGAVLLVDVKTLERVFVKPPAEQPSEVDGGFGGSASLSGESLAVGWPGEDSGPGGAGSSPKSGAVVLLRCSQGPVEQSPSWAVQSIVKAMQPSAGDRFGARVLLRGRLLFVWAPGDDSGGVGVSGPSGDSDVESGAIYIFEESGSAWVQVAKLKSWLPAPRQGLRFGAVMEMVGGELFVSDPFANASDSGGLAPLISGGPPTARNGAVVVVR